MVLRLLLVVSAVALSACPKNEEARVAEAPPPTPRLPESPRTPVGMPVPPDAEVKVIGTWRSVVTAAQHVAVAQKEPCVPVPTTPTRYGASVTLSAQGALVAAFFLPQGTVAHVCLYALDAAGAVVGAATMPDTPRVFGGLEALTVGPHAVEVKPL
jgi:hypothetical protein